MSFNPLFKIPWLNNPYYNTKSVGGFSPCIIGNIPKGATASKRTGYNGLNVLPNCVGFVLGRFNEIGDYGYCKYLKSVSAYRMIEIAKKQGLEVTAQPTLGGAMVWDNGSNGHCAIVEQINPDSSIVTSESGWSGLVFANYTRRNTDGNWRTGASWMGEQYKYLGCIKNPAVQSDEDNGDTMTQEQFNNMMNNYLAELKTEQPQDYAKNAVSWAKEVGIMLGDKDGNIMPRSFLTREDFAVMMQRILTGETTDQDTENE